MIVFRVISPFLLVPLLENAPFFGDGNGIDPDGFWVTDFVTDFGSNRNCTSCTS